jgi:hypothetical protein
VRSGGRCLLIEPWNTAWARAVYKNLHHEPFNPEGEWIIPSTGPLSGANGALPWILFERDKSVFKKKFPEWEIALISPIMPLSYLLSGGVSMRTFVPSSLYSLVRGIEKKIPGFDKNFGMFSFIVLNRI